MRGLIRAGLYLSLGVLVLCGCLGQARQWRWVHPDSGYADQNRRSDIDTCEQEAIDHSIDGPFHAGSARPYGGWGDFVFELCMEERGWALIQSEAGPVSKGKELD